MQSHQSFSAIQGRYHCCTHSEIMLESRQETADPSEWNIKSKPTNAKKIIIIKGRQTTKLPLPTNSVWIPICAYSKYAIMQPHVH